MSAKKKVETTSALAKHLGLSRWTVSRVLNKHSGIKEDTRRRVLDAMVELGFQPNFMARGLRGAQTHLVGVCFQEIQSPVLAKKTSILQRMLRERGYRALLELTDGNLAWEEEVIRHFLSLKVDGIVMVGSTFTADHPLVHALDQKNMPVIAVDPLHELPFIRVVLDRLWGMRLKMQHLYDLGHRQFALLGFSDAVPYGDVRLRGFREQAQRLGLDFAQDFQVFSGQGERFQDYHYGWELAKTLLSQKSPPSAIIALNDQLALGAIRRFQDSGYAVPGDFSVVGFDDLGISAFSCPTLTTVNQQIHKVMQTTVDLLLNVIGGQEVDKEAMHLIQPILEVRESTRARFP